MRQGRLVLGRACHGIQLKGNEEKEYERKKGTKEGQVMLGLVWA